LLAGFVIAFALLVSQAGPVIDAWRSFMYAPQNTMPARPIRAEGPLRVMRIMAHEMSPRKSVPVFPPSNPPKINQKPRDITGSVLQSHFREYSFQVSGRVTCGGRPCATDLELSAESASNPVVFRRFSSGDDGFFQMVLPLRDFQHEQIDWQIVAGSGKVKVEKSGRAILTDDPVVTVDTALTL
jgi:hypothetical protein